MENELTYEQAMSQLEKIVSQIETGDIDIDCLSEKLKEAKTLVSYCHDALKHVEKDVAKVLSEEE